MIISSRGISFLEDREGYRERAYRDEGGIWTVGFGTTWIDNRRVKFDDFCDKIQATVWLMDDIDSAQDAINKYLKNQVTQNQYDSLVSLTYNIGIDGFKNSTLLKTINKGAEIYKDLFLRWNKVTIRGKKVISKGLTNRRKLEYELFIRN